MKKLTSLIENAWNKAKDFGRGVARQAKRGVAVLAIGTGLAMGAPTAHAAAVADAAITAKVDDAKATFDAVLTAGLTITVSMIGWGFLKRVRKG